MAAKVFFERECSVVTFAVRVKALKRLHMVPNMATINIEVSQSPKC